MISKISKTIDYDKEFFVSIEGFPNYKVDVEGRVLNVKKNKILKPTLDDKGYYVVDLYKNGERKHQKIHKLVASCFLVKPNEKSIVHHINHIRSDNRIENLMYVSCSMNSRDKVSNLSVKYEFIDELPSETLHVTHVKGDDISEIGIYYNKQTDNFYIKMSSNNFRIMYKERIGNQYRINFSFNNRKINYSIKQLRNEYQHYFEEE